jgi:hypothetical protein
MSREVRGRIQNAVRPIGPCMAGGRKPVLLVYVKTHSSRHIKDFLYWTQKLAIQAKLLQSWGDVGAFEVCGAPHALEFLTGRQCILRWEYCLNVVPPRGGAVFDPLKAAPPPPPAKKGSNQREVDRKERVAELCQNDVPCAENKGRLNTSTRLNAIGIAG